MMRWRPLGVLCLAVVLLLPTSAQADEPLLDKKARSSCKSIVMALAKKKQGHVVRTLLEVLPSLGYPPTELDALRNKATAALGKAKRAKDASRDLKKLAKLAASWAERLAALPEDARAVSARGLLTIDADLEAARAVLGQVRHRGAWVPKDFVAHLDRRAKIHATIEKHRRQKYEIESGPSKDPFFLAKYGNAGAFARYGWLEVHVVRGGEPTARRILLQALRTWSLACELSGMDAKFAGATKVAILARYSELEACIQHALKTKRIDVREANLGRQTGSIRTKDGFLMARPSVEIYDQTIVALDAWMYNARAKLKGHATFVEAGYLSWCMLNVIGAPIPIIAWIETEWERKVGSTLDAKSEAERKRLLKLAQAGISGTRAYMRFLMERRLDPPLAHSFVDRLGKIRGHDLLKCTVFAEYMLEADVLGQALRKATGSTVTEIQPALEKALGKPLHEIEADLRAWVLLDERPGLLQTAGASSSDAGPVASLAARLLNDIREHTNPHKPPVTLETDLSEGCAAHARYLVLHPEMAKKWPDAHEEHVDTKGFSPAGARAGASSVIAPGVRSWKEAIDGWMGTFYHRLPLLHPGLLAVGAGQAGGVYVLDTGSLVDDLVSSAPIVWPHDGAKFVPTHFVPELPNPIPGEAQESWGYPITIQVMPDPGSPHVQMKLYQGHELVPCHVITPSRPHNPDVVPLGAYALIPKQPLQRGRKHTVKVYKLMIPTGDQQVKETSLEWSFTTAR